MNTGVLSGLSALNHKLFYMVNGVRLPWLDQAMVLGTHLGDFANLVWIVAAALLLLLAYRFVPACAAVRWLPRRDTVVACVTLLLVAYVVAACVVTALKVGLHMPRPAAALPAGSVHVLVAPESALSFPSGHATFAMLVALVFWPWCRGWGRVFLAVFVLWVGLSRISVGAHFPVDVITGYFCAAISVWVGARVLAFCPKMEMRK
ncbi:phosphatase PAP2 family protein [Comamonas nitrativorans]|uniref:Phosphatase PAP2 family protein n=1 Tax=Comamonas nitrativorans TaxID=108437 RepID=A0ABV9GXM9_9BURK